MKNITSKNYLKADPSSDAVSFIVTSAGEVIKMSSETWAEIILQSSLIDKVPEEIQNLFETARGALIYGYFFYPLYTLGCEQMTRVAEAASKTKCVLITAPKNRMKTFSEQIKFLAEQNLLSVDELQIWESLRQMRNSSSHLSQQNIYSPGIFIPMMEKIIDCINKLFE